MNYKEMLVSLFERSTIIPTDGLSRSSLPDDVFEADAILPAGWDADDPITSADPAFAARQLRHKINFGRLSPTAGEAEAQQNKCGPLNPLPDESLCDVATKSRWTLTMALAWVMWRSFDAVRAVDREWIATHKTWVPVKWESLHSASSRALFEEALGASPPSHVQRGWALLPIVLSPLAVLKELEPNGLTEVMPEQSLDEATESVWRALLDGTIKGEGLATGRWREITPVEWNGLRLEIDDRLGEDRVLDGRQSFRELRVPVAAILKLWPARAGKAPDRTLQTGEITDDEGVDLLLCVRAFFADHASPKKELISDHLKTEGWKFSDECFDHDLWQRIVREFPERNLNRPGRKKSPG